MNSTTTQLTDPRRLRQLGNDYRERLLNDTLQFWFPRSIDEKHGGYFTCFDRCGELMQTDKSIWFQGRMAWLLATLYTELEPRDEWLQWAWSGIDFLSQHGFDSDGRLFFSVTADGRPLRKRRYVFSECFAAIAFSAYGRASGETAAIDKAFSLLGLIQQLTSTPGALEPKTNPTTRPMKGLGLPMILISVCQELRKSRHDPNLDECIDRCIAEIEKDFLKPEFKCLLETVGPRGEFYDTLDGRQVNPGHSIEAGWFILEEARHRGDQRLLDLGLQILDWSWAAGWDPVHGGILYFTDCRGLSPTEYWHDMKFWWPHNEAVIATLLAWELSRDTRWFERHQLVHEWAHSHFPDSEGGEWFGYLHRDGTVSTPVKGNLFKGAFHLPRMQWSCSRIIDRITREAER